MKSIENLIIGCTAAFVLCCGLSAQQAAGRPAAVPAVVPAMVPQLVNFSGVALDAQGKPMEGIAGVTFYIYSEQYNGVPLWMETQNVTPDSKGNYAVQLGAATANGLPLDLFIGGEAHWLGVRINGGEEQPRVMLLSVPYALKAADAQTLGGLPASAFVLAAPSAGTGSQGSGNASASSLATPFVAPPLGGSGTVNFVPLWTPDGNTLGNSVLFQSGTGSAAKIGINTTTPASTLDVKGSATVRGTLSLPAVGTATAITGKNSQPEKLTASTYDAGSKAAVNENFQWQAEPAENNTPNPSGTLNLLFGSGSSSPVETGLYVASNGVMNFAAGQTFPGTGPGTVTGVTAGTDLTGGGTSGTVTLSLDITKVPQLNTANTFTGNQTVNGNLTAPGVVSGGSYQIGSNLFAFGSYANLNSFLGFAGNTTTTGYNNTALGEMALISNTSASSNTALGVEALYSNTTGGYNTGSGLQALYANTSGQFNTATGEGALIQNTTGSYNTADGVSALWANYTGGFNTAVGFAALAGGAGYDNTAEGYAALASSYGGSNTGEGAEALYSDTTGSDNTAVGFQALYANTTGNFLTCIGYDCSTAADSLSNATAIGAHAVVGMSNSLVLGGTGSWAVKVGIGTETPSNVLTIARGAGHPVSDSWETYSSRRWKTNIKTLPDALTKVEHLRGVSYDLRDSGKHEIGVIAEEVGAVVPEVVSYEANGKDASGVDYSRLTALLIEAVKQQQRQIRADQEQLTAQREEIRKLLNKGRLLESKLSQVQRMVDQLQRVRGEYARSTAPTLTTSIKH